MPVHLHGQPCELDQFVRLARKHEIPLIQDAAQAHGARFNGKPLAAFSRYIAYSFYPTKNLGCLITDRAATKDRLIVVRRSRIVSVLIRVWTSSSDCVRFYRI